MQSGDNSIRSVVSEIGVIEALPLQFDIVKINTVLNELYAKVKFDSELNDLPNNSVWFNLNHPATLPASVLEAGEAGKYVGQIATGEQNLKLKYGLTHGDFTVMPDFVKNSYIGEVYNQLVDWHNLNKLSLGTVNRVHCAYLGPGASYRFHKDPHTTIRYHIAVTTNPYCYMMAQVGDEVISTHIPADGRVWLLDTSVYHTALNLFPNMLTSNNMIRTHMIFSVSQ
jgi:hypothetical protein